VRLHPTQNLPRLHGKPNGGLGITSPFPTRQNTLSLSFTRTCCDRSCPQGHYSLRPLRGRIGRSCLAGFATRERQGRRPLACGSDLKAPALHRRFKTGLRSGVFDITHRSGQHRRDLYFAAQARPPRRIKDGPQLPRTTKENIPAHGGKTRRDHACQRDGPGKMAPLFLEF